MIDLSNLNEKQIEAVVNTEGPLLILAGAGSGKTKVLTYKIAYILDSKLANSNNILAMTFTNKAAKEMQERIIKLVEFSSIDENNKYFSWLGTFHSIGVRILKKFGEIIVIDKNFSIFDSSEQKEVVKFAMEKLNLSTKEFNPSIIHTYISLAKNNLITPQDYRDSAQGYIQQITSQVYPVYEHILRENNALDFDDLLSKTLVLLKSSPSVLSMLQDQFRYVLVDEYQDTNYAQYLLLKMLVSNKKNICVVGDDDQSIYSFRGATIKNILDFEKDFPNTKVIKLEQNYRSTSIILEASNQVISKNINRKGKTLWTQNQKGDKIKLYVANTETEEAKWVVQQIKYLSNSVNLNEIAILYRANYLSRNFEEEFLRMGIPYKIYGGTNFYERKEIKDIVSFLKSIYNKKDITSLKRIINIPKRGIGESTFSDLLEKANQANLNLIDYILQNSFDHPGINKFKELITEIYSSINYLTVSDLIKLILDKTKYITHLETSKSDNESKIENIGELISVASKFDDKIGMESVESFLDEVSLLDLNNNDDNIEKEKVNLMTIHSSKGLEFDYVFVVGMEEGVFPSSMSILTEKELEEERRLAYVAITRAKKQLYFSYALTRRKFGVVHRNISSRFLKDINNDLLEEVFEKISGFSDYNNDFVVSEYNDFDYDKKTVDFSLKPGNLVKHSYFGVGKIISVYDDYVLIDFGGVYGKKEFLIEYLQLEDF